MKSIQFLLQNDKIMYQELLDNLSSGKNIPLAKKMGFSQDVVMKAMTGPVAEFPMVEAMIRLYLRPALLIKNNKILPPDSAELRARLLPYFPKLESRVPSIGRIDLRKLGKTFGGTGWMVTEDILVTNRHVARIFAEKKGRSLVFRKNALGETVEVFIDYKEEYTAPNLDHAQFEVAIEKVLYIADEGKTNPDIAFLKVRNHAALPAPIPISDKALSARQSVSVIGYPAYDPNGIISQDAAAKLFGGIYEVKRCSPGEVMVSEPDSWYFFHDCLTLGGNSGSAVIDNATGLAVGLHFMGEVEKENYAVKGADVLKHLLRISPKVFVPDVAFVKLDDDDVLTGKQEATPESFTDRDGFQPKFLGDGFPVPLPKVKRGKAQLLSFLVNNKQTTELKYRHFSVLMNKTRRMCFFSACNIDGKLSKRGVARTTWKTDPRIPEELQIIGECYGNPPKFSRGHMTRKEDPIWGELEVARQAASDTFHVTNATPQMQPFNAPIWLALENYALENARQDEMKISVITGPILEPEDPLKYGIQVPVEFFKIICFIHDQSGKLTATGYTVSQESSLSTEEFVFGQFNTYQVAIKSIERRTGLDFGPLSAVDPIQGEEAAFAALSAVEDIRFV